MSSRVIRKRKAAAGGIIAGLTRRADSGKKRGMPRRLFMHGPLGRRLVGPGLLMIALCPVLSASAGEAFVNSLGMRFLKLEADVWLCIHETRIEDFEAFASATGVALPGAHFPQEPDHPVVNVSWEDAKRFCAWLTEKERAAGTIPETRSYRLPTEAEWERAAGLEPGESLSRYATDPLRFTWGESWPPPLESGNFAERMGVDPFPYTAPALSFSPNERGYYNLSGNVWEWCEDSFEGAQDVRVLKGGSWRMYEPSRLAVNRRIGNQCGLRLPTYGFRLALVEEVGQAGEE